MHCFADTFGQTIETMLKKTSKLTALIALLLITGELNAQQPFFQSANIDVNNINATVLLHGDMNLNHTTNDNACEYPKGSGKHVMSASGIWMSAYDAGNNLRVSAQTYRQSGNDYWPGPLDNNASLNIATSTSWARIWKVNFTDINNHMANSTHTANNTPADIWEWPAKDNPNAKGNNGAALTVTRNMAPYVDVNSDGKYNAADGDYPDIKGDQMVWWVFSDNGPTHNNHSLGSASIPLGVEVHACAYAYKRGGLLDNVIYYEFDVTNRSSDDLKDFRFAINADADLGYYLDDYIGFDSARRMGYVYNGISIDGGSSGGPESYGSTPPIAGYTLLEAPGDNGSTITPTGSFMYFNNDGTVYGNPTVDSEYNGYMRSAFRDGQHLQNDFTKKGVITNGRGSGPMADYVYSGNPDDTTEWSECNCNNPVGDRRFVLSTTDASLNNSSSVSVAYALVISDRGTTNACPNVDIDPIKRVADTAWKYYRNSPKSFVSVTALEQGRALGLYPNPANNVLRISMPVAVQAGSYTLHIYDVSGKVMNTPYRYSSNELEADVSSLPAGVYHVVYTDKNTRQSGSFVKE